MANEITMPRLSDTMTEGTVSKWRKQIGEKVEKGDILVDIETDKATMELEAFQAGVLGRIVVNEGATVPIGDLIALLVAPGEELPADTGAAAPAAAVAPAAQPAPEAAPVPVPAPAPMTAVEAAPQPMPPVSRLCHRRPAAGVAPGASFGGRARY